MADRVRLQIKTSVNPEVWEDVGSGSAGVAVPIDIDASGIATSDNQTNNNQTTQIVGPAFSGHYFLDVDSNGRIGATLIGADGSPLDMYNGASLSRGIVLFGYSQSDSQVHPIIIDSNGNQLTKVQETVPTDTTKLNGTTVVTGLSVKGDDLTVTDTIAGINYQFTVTWTGTGPYTCTISQVAIV